MSTDEDPGPAVSSPDRPVRLGRFLTTDEQAWLTGAGEEPVEAGHAAPARAPRLLPAAGLPGQQWAVRGWAVEPDGHDVVLRGHRSRVLSRDVRRLVWLVDGGEHSARTAPRQLGVLVLDDGTPQPAALVVEDWVPGEPRGSSTDGFRMAGARELAAALGVPLEVVTRHDVLWAQGVRLMRPRLRPVLGAVALALLLAVLAVVVALLETAPDVPLTLDLDPTHAVVGAFVGALALLVSTPLLVVLRRGLLGRRARRGCTTWWARDRVAGLGVRGTGAQQELVVLDELGWGTRLPGPQAGGVTTAVVTGSALVLLDAGQQQLLALDWGAGPTQVLRQAGATVVEADGPVEGVHVPPAALPGHEHAGSSLALVPAVTAAGIGERLVDWVALVGVAAVAVWLQSGAYQAKRVRTSPGGRG